MISFCRIQIVPRDAPNIVLAAIQNGSAFSHVVSNAILWVAVVLKAVREDCNRFDAVIVAAEDEVGLRLNHDALSDTKGRLQLQLPKSINTRQGKTKPEVPSDHSLIPLAVVVADKLMQEIGELFLKHASEQRVWLYCCQTVLC